MCLRKIKPALFLSFVIICFAGCSLKEISEEANAVHDAGIIYGEVSTKTGKSEPIHVLLFAKKEMSVEPVDKIQLQNDGKYRFYTAPGEFYLGAYQDINNDGAFQRSEPAILHGGTKPDDAKQITVNSRDKIKIEKLTISQPLESVKREEIKFENTYDNTGEVVSLDDSRFSREIASLGLWKPLSFINNYGVGLYLLGPYKSDKLPVIFIHGANGTPFDFSSIIDSLDYSTYQPWVYHYPSGVSLDIVSDYLVESINKLQNQYQFQNFVIIAHSMGGLVMRSTVKKYLLNDQKAKILLAMSINSPMLGMDSAAQGVKMSPIVVPSWYDVAKGSDFINTLMGWSWPDDIPYHLIFSYEQGEGSDGVVPLESQIPLSLQNEAIRLYGFKSGHALVLTDPGFIDTFNRIMDSR